MNTDERFKGIAGRTYENKIDELYIIIKEKQMLNEDTTDYINNLIEVMAEYKEWKKWAKKEIKRRQKEAIQTYINEYNKKYNI